MKSASVAEVKNRLSSYLRDVQRGKQVIITNRGESIAKIVAIDPGEELGLNLNDCGRQMVRDGRLILPKKKWDPVAFNKLPMPGKKHNLPNPIVQEREEGF